MPKAIAHRRDAVFDPESFDPELMTEGLRPKGVRKGFYKEIFSLRALRLCGETYKNDRSTLSTDPEDLEGRLSTGRIFFLLFGQIASAKCFFTTAE